MALLGTDSRTDCRTARFSDALIRDLRALAMSGRGGLTGSGVETGGLLIGGMRHGELCIEGFQEAPCEHRFGPSYILSEVDRIKLAALLRERRCAAGFFRTFIAHDPASEDADDLFVRRYYPHCDCVYLMLRALPDDTCVASVCWFRDGAPRRLLNEGPFPFESGRVPTLEVAGTIPVRAVTRPRRLWATALVCLLLGLCGGIAYQLWSLEHRRSGDAAQVVAAAIEKHDALHLDARLSGTRVEITWSGDDARKMKVNSGKLSIKDGGTAHEFELGSNQVTLGRYRYAALHPNVAVRLTLSADDREVANGTISLAAARIDSVPNAQPAPAPAPAPAVRAAFVPPAVVHEVQPTIPEGIRSRLTEEIVIPVEVQVNERGRVLSARVDDRNEDGLHRYLAEQAGKVAREWQFAPARTRDGEAVPGSRTIQIVFTP
jgi:TonB family protein